MVRMRYALRSSLPAKPADFAAYSDTLATLLAGRGMTTREKAEEFLAPSYDRHVHDPFLMRHMDRAVDRVYAAIKAGERVAIFSDYDADGIPGGVVLHDAFKRLGFTNFENYIPHRHDEGFGLSDDAVDELAGRGAKLLITIDCGIADVDEVARAMAKGVDVIVTDHHLPHADLPPAYAILNPKVDGCQYPEKMLCGSGVIFKFIQALFKKHGAEFGVPAGWEKWLLDLVGIATLSDMVPLTGENRALAHYGLQVLKKTRRPGLSRLFTKLKVSREHLSEDDIGFTITPRINAASRMGAPEEAFRLLSTDDEALAGAYADALERVNDERKGTVAALVKEIRKEMEKRDASTKSAIVMGNPSWRPSLLGLVANSLAEEYGKPAFLWGRDGSGILKGSCRSGGNASVVAVMDGAAKAAEGLFLEYGGHAASGGFAVTVDKVHELEDRLCAALDALKAAERSSAQAGEAAPKDFYDAAIGLDEVTWALYRDIEKLAPYGTGNPKPVFLIKGAFVDAVKSFGKTGDHIELVLRDNNLRKVTAIRFFFTKDDLPKHVASQGRADILVHLEKSAFKGYPELRLRIVDIL